MIIMNLDKGLKTFGTNRPFKRVSFDPCLTSSNTLVGSLSCDLTSNSTSVGCSLMMCKIDRALIRLQILDSDDPEECLPLYLRPNDPMCTPTLSHNSPTNNLLLKITVPKRTGRKRKRGSQEPYTENTNKTVPLGHGGDNESVQIDGSLRSVSRLDSPAQILRKLRDNIGKYDVQTVAEIKHTHRFRGRCPNFVTQIGC